MLAVPTDTPVTFPLASTVATVGVPLLQVPPVMLSLNVIVEPAHTEVGPLILPASAS